jgi:CRISPR type IV-associated protein Csf1
VSATSQFVARSLRIDRFPPPEPARGRRFAKSASCWLCGGDTGRQGWPREAILPPTFTQHNIARRGDSDAICQPCAAILSGESFKALVAARALPVKTWTQCGWHSYSHFVREDGYYAVPDRETSRAILLDPPGGRWLLALNPTGQQHTIIRASVATGRDSFPVQFGEERVWVRCERLARCLAAFEALSALGFSKDDTLGGRYHPESMRRAGLARWRPAEEAIRPWREREPSLMGLVYHVARSPKFYASTQSVAPPPVASKPAPPAPIASQMEMF